MADGEGTAAAGGAAKQQDAGGPSDRFPALRQLEEDAERAKLEQALAESQAATAKAKLPSLDVTLGTDTVTVGDKTTGLDRVLVQMDAIALADDIADSALNAARTAGDKRKYRFLVVGDAGALEAFDVHRLLSGQLDRLRTRIDDYLPPEEPKEQPGHEAVMAFGAAAAVGLGVQALGLATKLFAHTYQWSGKEVTVDDLGVDLDVAHYLGANRKPDETVEVEVERVRPTSGSSTIVEALRTLADDGEQRLAPALAADAVALAKAKAAADTSTAAITALDNEIVELTKKLPDTAEPLDQRKQERAEVADGIPALAGALADAQSRYDKGRALLSDLEGLLTSALTPPAGGGRPPALAAARVEPLLSTEGDALRMVLYVRPIAAGVDQTIETKLGPDWFAVLTGATAEFALLTGEGELLASGVRSVLQSSRMKLDDPDSFRQRRVDYVGAQRDPDGTPGQSK